MRYDNVTSPGALFTGEPVDVGQYLLRWTVYSAGGSYLWWPANCPNMGFIYCSTPYVYNTYTNFIVTVEQVPPFTIFNNATTNTAPDVDRLANELFMVILILILITHQIRIIALGGGLTVLLMKMLVVVK